MSNKYQQIEIPESENWRQKLVGSLIKAFGQGGIKTDQHNSGVLVVRLPANPTGQQKSALLLGMSG